MKDSKVFIILLFREMLLIRKIISLNVHIISKMNSKVYTVENMQNKTYTAELIMDPYFQIPIQEWFEQNKETVIPIFLNDPALIHPWVMIQLREWESDKETPHETTCQMYEYFLQTLETLIELPPSLSSKEIWENGAKIGLGKYDISNYGHVRNPVSKKCLKGSGEKSETYIRHTLITDDNTKFHTTAHHLTAMLFIPNPENKPMPDHINRIKTDNRCLNLRWSTSIEQNNNRRKAQYRESYAVYQYDLENNLVNKWNSANEAASETGGYNKSIRHACCRGTVYMNHRWFYDYMVEVDEDEEWRLLDLEEYEPFEISSKGRIRKSNGEIHDGHKEAKCRIVNIRNLITQKYDRHSMHNLVADAFLGKRGGLVVNHKNGNKHDNRVENLELVTRQELMLHAHEIGLFKTRKAVRQIDPDTDEIVAEYKSMSEASQRTGVHSHCISRVCKGLAPLGGGFKWEFVNEGSVGEIKKRLNNWPTKSVRQIDPNTGETIAEYPSATIAALETGLNFSGIANACRGASKTSGGFIWEYC